MLRRWLRGCVSRLPPCVSQSLRSDVRCCDAGSGVLSGRHRETSGGAGVTHRGRQAGDTTPELASQHRRDCETGSAVDAVTLVASVSLCLDASGSDARCCDAGSGVVSAACPFVSQSRPRCCDAGSGACLPVSRSLCDAVSARCCDGGSTVVSPACLPVSRSDVTPAPVLNAVIATHGHGRVSTHARWLYNLIRVANAAVCKLMQVLSCFACGKTFSRAREEDINQKWHVPSLGRKLLRLMRKFQQSSETATKCCGDGKVH